MLMETLPARFVGRFELLRTEPSEMAVASRAIVEGIDVVGHIGDRARSVLVHLLLMRSFLRLLKNHSATAWCQQWPLPTAQRRVRYPWSVGKIRLAHQARDTMSAAGFSRFTQIESKTSSAPQMRDSR